MWASWIMPTSLAPSPMPSVTTPVLFTSAVTSAFCLGDTRQHTTAAHALPTCAREARARLHRTFFTLKLAGALLPCSVMLSKVRLQAPSAWAL